MLVVEGARILTADRDLALDRIDDRHRKIDSGHFRTTLEVAGRKDVHLQDLVPDDVDPDQEHAIGDELGPDKFGNLQLGRANLDRLGGTAGMNIGANIVLRLDPAKRGIFAIEL